MCERARGANSGRKSPPKWPHLVGLSRGGSGKVPLIIGRLMMIECRRGRKLRLSIARKQSPIAGGVARAKRAQRRRSALAQGSSSGLATNHV